MRTCRRFVMAWLLGWGGVMAADAAQPPGLLQWSGWLVYWDLDDGFRALTALGPSAGEIAVFAYHFNDDGRLVAAAPELEHAMARLQRTRAEGPSRTILVTLVNDRTGPNGLTLKDPVIVHQVLASPDARAAHIHDILTVSAPFDGVEIDYENLRLEDRAAFTAFVEALADAVHQRGQRLAVVVQPKVKEVFKDGPALAAAADEIKVMAYHYHWATGAPGPLAPPGWVAEVADYAAETIPLQKRCVALTMHGFDWPVSKPATSIDYHQAMALASAHRARIRRDRDSASPYFRYRAADGLHEVWFEDAASLREKVKVLHRAGIPHIAMWRLGGGDPDFLHEAAARVKTASGT